MKSILKMALLALILISIGAPLFATGSEDCEIYNIVLFSDWRFQAERCHASVVYVPAEPVSILDVWNMSSYSKEKKYKELASNVDTKEEEALLEAYIKDDGGHQRVNCELDIRPQYKLIPKHRVLIYLRDDCATSSPSPPSDAIGFLYFSNVFYNKSHTRALVSWGFKLCDDCIPMNRIAVLVKTSKGWRFEKNILEQVC